MGKPTELELTMQQQRNLYDVLIKAFYGYKLHLSNEVQPSPDKFEEMAYRNYHMLPTDYTKIEFNFLKPTIDSIVGHILELENNDK